MANLLLQVKRRLSVNDWNSLQYSRAMDNFKPPVDDDSLCSTSQAINLAAAASLLHMANSANTSLTSHRTVPLQMDNSNNHNQTTGSIPAGMVNSCASQNMVSMHVATATSGQNSSILSPTHSSPINLASYRRIDSDSGHFNKRLFNTTESCDDIKPNDRCDGQKLLDCGPNTQPILVQV